MTNTTASAVLSIGLSFMITSTAGAQVATVPLPSILTTSPQDGMLPISTALAASGEDAAVSFRFLRQILQDHQGGASNTFLVEAAVARYALAASAQVFLGEHSVTAPVVGNPAANLDHHYWLAAYLGTGPNAPAKWVIEEVQVRGNKIIMSYHQAKTSRTTPDAQRPNAQRYYYWVPLGKLPPETYHVELFDTHSQATTLMRRIEIR